MDISYYKAKVDGKLKNDARKEQEKKEREEQEAELAWCELMTLSDRVRDILDLANYCIKNGIELDDKYIARNFGWGEGNVSFVADGIYHRIGFDAQCRKQRGMNGGVRYASALCVYAGGACGVWDFYVNEDGCFLQEESDSARNRGCPGCPRIVTDKVKMHKKMEYFIKVFPVFEKAFLSYLDSLS